MCSVSWCFVVLVPESGDRSAPPSRPAASELPLVSSGRTELQACVATVTAHPTIIIAELILITKPQSSPLTTDSMVTVEEYLVAADEMVAKVLSQWDLTSTALAGLLALFTAYLVLSQTQPDTHPMLLARQAQPSPVRQPGQSAVYRSHTSPHGLDLNHGLNVKDPGANNWGPGRNGDLRDVWRRVVQGKVDGDGQGKGVVGRIITVLGSEETIDHDLSKFSCDRRTCCKPHLDLMLTMHR